MKLIRRLRDAAVTIFWAYALSFVCRLRLWIDASNRSRCFSSCLIEESLARRFI
jgi:hypothetical protein